MYPFLLLQVYTTADSDTFPSWLHHIGLVRMSCVLAGSLVDHMAVCSYLIWQISWVAVSFVFLLLACFLKYWVFCFVVYIPAPSISSITDWVVLFSFCCPFICADLISTAAMLLVPASPPLAIPRAHSASPAPKTTQMSDHGWAAIQRRHCTAAESLQWCSVMPVLIEHRQITICYAPYW